MKKENRVITPEELKDEHMKIGGGRMSTFIGGELKDYTVTIDAPTPKEVEEYIQMHRITKEEIREILSALEGLKRGSCWCQMAIGHPMMKSHSEACIKVQEIMNKHGRR